MAISISSGLLDAILRQAATSPDVEICGLLFGTAYVIEAATPARNVHASPARHFEVDPSALIAAHKAERAGGPRVIGHYHSHPSGDVTPSQEDVRSSDEGRLSLIVGGGDASLYRFVNAQFSKEKLNVSN